MKLYRENDAGVLRELESQPELFKHEVATDDDDLDMHTYFVRNRNIIFGQYLYLLHEAALSAESYIDFVAFTESGAVLLIEIKRASDTRNRQEVVSQLGKYAMDAFSINNIIADEANFKSALSDSGMENRPFEIGLIGRVRTNVQSNNLNLFLVTEDATDELLASVYYLSYGARNQKVSVIELKRHKADGETLCFVRQFNKQTLLNSTRKRDFTLESKLDLMTDPRIRSELERVVSKWIDMGYSIKPLSISTPEYFTFEWTNGQSAWVSFYIMQRAQANLSEVVRKNSVAIYVMEDESEILSDVVDWIRKQREYYQLETKRGGKSRPYKLHCIDITDLESDEIDAIFEKVKEVAEIRRRRYVSCG